MTRITDLEARIGMVRGFHVDCAGCPTEDLCDDAESLLSELAAAEALASSPEETGT